ncbi:ribosomal RNA processing protein 36 homolog [Anopheles nili]|uniref:ribosomal RNA processing protein 36 homolog n=1 Tax=Anopheles nili TaxID=185578 RepID=UPI00237A95B8|nr:ribosomal RNA processing protein 36 homolog [Anopheles nili]
MNSSETDSDNERSEGNEDFASSAEEESSNESMEESSDEDVPKLADDEYKDMPFEDLLRLKKKLGSRMYNEAIFGKMIERKQTTQPKKSIKKLKKATSISANKSDDDSGPEEVSSKRKVPALGMGKQSKAASIQRPRDPRFDPRQGYFSGRQFRENFSFLNDLRKKELNKLKNKLEAATDPEDAQKLKFVIQRTENQMREYAKQRALDEEKQRNKRSAREAIQEGKRPFYERKSTKQARALVEQYDKLKEAGKLDRHLEKRRKKISAKDRKKLDFAT